MTRPQFPPTSSALAPNEAIALDQIANQASRRRWLGARIRTARRVAGLSQEDLARVLGISTGYVSKIETGQVRFKPRRFAMIAESLHTTPEALMDLKPDVALPRQRSAEEIERVTQTLETLTKAWISFRDAVDDALGTRKTS